MAARVGTVCGNGHQHSVKLFDFDPATMDVVIVAKDARRVWVDNYGGKNGWSTLRLEREDFPQNADYECIEFVAVETRRPPEQSTAAWVEAKENALHQKFVASMKSPEPVQPANASEDYEPIPADVQAEVSAVMRAAGIPRGCFAAEVSGLVPNMEAE